MSMNSYPENKLVKKCLAQIEEKLGWGNSDEWHNDVFIELSDSIHKKTKVVISTTTLKRVWGKVNYTNAPSISTLNTLAQFAGYTNWREFKNKGINRRPTWIERKINPNLAIIVPSAALLSLIFIALFSMDTISNHSNDIDLTKIEFDCHPITNDIPNSVVFDFDLNTINSDSIYIQQFWDETKTIKIKSNQKQATGVYYYPGYFRAKLLVDRKILKESDLFIKSNGWLATLDYTPIPKYIKSLSTLNLPKDILQEVKESDVPLTSTFHLVDDFKSISGDNFRLNTTIQNVFSDKWAVCKNATIIIVGTKSAHMIPFAIRGCSSNMGMMLSDVYLDGKEHDLSALSLDLSNPVSLKLEVIDKQMTVFANNKALLSTSYNESIGRIVGIRYRFLGAGKIHEVKLTNLSENLSIINNFEYENSLK